MPDFHTRRPPQGPSRMSNLLASAAAVSRIINRQRRRWLIPAGELLHRYRLVASFLVGLLLAVYFGHYTGYVTLDLVHHPSMDQMPKYVLSSVDDRHCHRAAPTVPDNYVVCRSYLINV